MVSVDVKHHVYLLPNAWDFSPRRYPFGDKSFFFFFNQNQEAWEELCELGEGAGPSRSKSDSLLLQLVTAFGFVDNVFKTFFLTAAETASCRVRPLIRNGWLPTTY